jgi:hypothetical protein
MWPNGLRGEESKKSANQKQESPVVAMSWSPQAILVSDWLILKFLLL